MNYQEFGKTGVKISRLGFGAMRLPMKDVGGKEVVDEEQSLAMMWRAFEHGVNYIDSAWFYCNGLSENTVGKALKGWRDKVYVSTKYPFKDESLRATLEKQLARLDTPYIDFYHLHGIGEWFFTREDRDTIIREIIQAKEEGLIKHISFSFHDKPEVMDRIMELGIFESVLCQYNLLDRRNETVLAHAKSRGLGTIVMGPVAGGKLVELPQKAAEAAGVKVKSNAELALRFVLANPNIDCALSGMSTMAQVEENVAIASNLAPLSPAEAAGISRLMDENKRLADLYCTGCNYCMPHCPQQVNIPFIFSAMNLYRVYDLKESGRSQYHFLETAPWVKGKKANSCIECGVCEEHCPQKIEIRKQLKECRELFES